MSTTNMNEQSPGSCSYQASVNASHWVSEPLVIKVQGNALDFGVDHAMTLKDYIIVRGKPPLATPASAQYQRQAAGGMPPYTYCSLDEQVAQVSDEGVVTAAGNGTAIISASDAVGHVAQYAITFSGIVQVTQYGPVDWGATVNDRRWLGRALDLQEMKRFYDLYHPGLSDIEAYLDWQPVNEYWTSTNILTNDRAKTFLMRTGKASDKQGGTRLLVVFKDP
jgi:hypothetical protein